MTNEKSSKSFKRAGLVAVLVILGFLLAVGLTAVLEAACPACPPCDGALLEDIEAQGAGKTRMDWAIAKKLTVLAGGTEFGSLIDLAGNCLDMDADGDSSLCADTDDQIDVELGGADEYVFTTSLFDLSANCLDMDADNDTSLCADTDDQIDIEVGGADEVVIGLWDTTVTTDTTAHLVEIIETTSIYTAGTNVAAALNIDLGTGNSTAGTNSVYGILIDDITGDAQNTETAFAIGGTGWNIGIDAAGNQIDLDADNDTSITADTDDQIDIEIAGADDFQFTANTFTAQAGSSIALASGAFPLGFATSGSQLVYGTETVTDTVVASHGLTTVTACFCTLGEDPDTDAGDPVTCTAAVSSNVCTVSMWQDDWSAAATSATVHWLVIGVP